MINNFFTLLNRGVFNTDGRMVEDQVYKEVIKASELHQLLVPVSDDKYSTLCTEQLLQYILESDYASRLTVLDPLNTYSKPIITLSDNSYVVTNPSDMDVSVLNESLTDPRWSEKSYSVSIDVSDLEAMVASQGLATTTYTFTMINNLSDKIPLSDSIFLRLGGTLSASDFMLGISYEQKFTRDMVPVLDSIDNINIPWYTSDYTTAYIKSRSTLDKVAILTMNLYEILRDGSTR